MSTPVPIDDFSAWLASFAQPVVLLELLILLACAVLAWVLVRALKQILLPQANDSIWFGARVVDGVLFPTVLLALGFAARTWWATLGHSNHAFQIAIPVLLALVVIRVGVKVLQVAFRQAAWLRPIERSISWLVWLSMVLWVSGLLPVLLNELDQITWKIGGSKLSVRTLIEGSITAGAVLLLTLWISSAIEDRLLRAASSGSELSLRKALSNATRALLMFVGLMLALSTVGIDLSALSVLGGAIGVGIGFGLQKLAANYVSGFVILTERSMRIGDMVRVDTFEGKITDIKARFTVIRSLSGREAIIPNETLITSRVENWSLTDSKLWQSTVVHIPYDSDVDKAMRLLVAAAAAQPRVLADPAPLATLSAFVADGLEVTLGYWIADPANGTSGLKSDINLAILSAFRAEGVEIAHAPTGLQMVALPTQAVAAAVPVVAPVASKV